MPSNYIREIYKLKDGTYEIEVMISGKVKTFRYDSEEKAFDAYVELCDEVYA